MTDLMRYAASLESVVGDSMPPVEKWNPPFSGDIDILIEADGRWFHDGAPIERARLVRLFSTILKREGDEYFLVTPIEKYRIRVTDVPFIGVAVNIDERGGAQQVYVRTNVGDKALVGPDHPLDFREQRDGGGEQRAPYVTVRRGLEARLNRSAYFDLVDACQVCLVDGVEKFGLMSAGVFFPMATATELFGEQE